MSSLTKNGATGATPVPIPNPLQAAVAQKAMEIISTKGLATFFEYSWPLFVEAQRARILDGFENNGVSPLTAKQEKTVQETLNRLSTTNPLNSASPSENLSSVAMRLALGTLVSHGVAGEKVLGKKA